MTTTPFTPAILAAALALSAVAGVAGAQTPAPQDDFEAALRNATAAAPSAAPAPRATRGGRGSGPGGRGARQGAASGPRPIAAAGVMPANFRTMTRLNDETEGAIRIAVREGRLDPVAMMEQLARPLPVPQGAFALRCRNDHNEVVYSLGVDASPAYMAALRAALASSDTSGGGMVNGQVVASPAMRFVGERESLADSPSSRAARDKALAHLTASGFVRSGNDIVGRPVYRPGATWPGHTPIYIVFDNDPWHVESACRRQGVDIPYGPVMIVRYG